MAPAAGAKKQKKKWSKGKGTLAAHSVGDRPLSASRFWSGVVMPCCDDGGGDDDDTP